MSDARFLSNVVAYVCADDEEIEAEVDEALRAHGGHVLKAYDPDICTHVIAAATSMEHPVCRQAADEGKKVYTDLWLRACINEGAVLPLSAPLHHPPVAESGIPGAEKLVLCLTGFTGDIRKELQFLAGLIGTGFSKPLKVYEVTHLICYEFSGDKYTVAKARGIKTVNHHWLYDCYMQWRLLPEERYQLSSKDVEEEKQASAAQLPGDGSNGSTDAVRAGPHNAPHALAEQPIPLAEGAGQLSTAGVTGSADVERPATGASIHAAPETMEAEAKRVADDGRGQNKEPLPVADQSCARDRAGPHSAVPHPTAADALQGPPAADNDRTSAVQAPPLLKEKEACATDEPGGRAQKLPLPLPAQARQTMAQPQPNPCQPSLPPAERASAELKQAANTEAQPAACGADAPLEQAVQDTTVATVAKDEVEGLSRDLREEAPAQGIECLDPGPHQSPADKAVAAEPDDPVHKTEGVAERCVFSEINDATRLGATENKSETKRSRAGRGGAVARGRGKGRGRGRGGKGGGGLANQQHDGHVASPEAQGSLPAHSPAQGNRKGHPNTGRLGKRGGRTPGTKRGVATESPGSEGAEEPCEPESHEDATTPDAGPSTKTGKDSDGTLDGKAGAKRTRERASSKRAKTAARPISRARAEAEHSAEEQAKAEAVPSPERSREAPEASAALQDFLATDTAQLLDTGGKLPITGSPAGDAAVAIEVNAANPKESPEDEWAEVDVATAQQAGLCSREDGSGSTLQLGSTIQSLADAPGAACAEGGARKDGGRTVALGDSVSPPADLASVPLHPPAPCQGEAEGLGASEETGAPKGSLLTETETGGIGYAKRKGSRRFASGPRLAKPAKVESSARQGKANAASSKDNDLDVACELNEGPSAQVSEPDVAAAQKRKRGRPAKADAGGAIKKTHTAGNAGEKVTGDPQRETGTVAEAETEAEAKAEAERTAGDSAPKESEASTARGKRKAAPAMKSNKLADPFDFVGTQEASRLDPEVQPSKVARGHTAQRSKASGAQTALKREPEGSSKSHGSDQLRGPGQAAPVQAAKQSRGAKGKSSAVPAQQQKEQVRWFSFGGIAEEKMREELKRQVAKLGGKVCGGSQKGSDDKLWDKRSTHVILGAPFKRTEKLLGAAAAGRWILQPEYVKASAKAHKFLPEEDFEWNGAGLNDDGTVHLSAPRWWREQRQRSGLAAFHGVHVALLDDIGPRAGALERALAGGGATVHLLNAAAKAPTKAVLQKLDFLVMAPGMTDRALRLAESVKEYGGACVAPDFFVEWIAKAGLDAAQQQSKGGGARLLAESLKAHVLLDSIDATCAAIEHLQHAHEDAASLLEDSKEQEEMELDEEADEEGSIDLGGSVSRDTDNDAEGDSAEGRVVSLKK